MSTRQVASASPRDLVNLTAAKASGV